MDIYEYRGRNRNGDLIRGTIEAADEEGVAGWMVSMGISPVDIRLRTDGLRGQPDWLKSLQGIRKLNQTDLLFFTRQMSTMFRAGVPLIQSIDSIKRTSSNQAMTDLLRSLSNALNRGSELSAALSQHPKFFSEYYVNMIAVGESAGELDQIFQRLYEQLDFDRRMRQKIKSVLRYPMFVLIAITVALVIMMVYIVPVFAKVYANMSATLPQMTLILIGFSNFLTQKWWLAIILFSTIYFALKQYLKTEEGRLTWDRMKLRLPVLGSLMRKATTARFCRSFATSMKAGVPIVSALTLVSRIVENRFYELRILKMRDRISSGDSILRSFVSAGIFEPIEIQMISVGEESGDVDGMISQLATLYQEEVEYEASRLAETLEPLLLALMAGLVLILLLGIFMPMWNLTQVVGR